MSCRQTTSIWNHLPHIVRIALPEGDRGETNLMIKAFLATSDDASGWYKIFRTNASFTLHFSDAQSAVFFKLRFG